MRRDLLMSDTDNTVYLHDVIRDDIAGRMREAVEAAGHKADVAALQRAAEAQMADIRKGRRAH
jgi:hypothetical protein